MLAGAGVDRQYEHEPSWAPRPVGHRGGCDRELHADADGRVYVCQPALGRVMGGAAVGGLVHFCEQGCTPLLRGGHRCPEIWRNAGATSTPPRRRSSARSSSVRPFSSAGAGALLAPTAERGVRDGGESDGANSPGARAAQSSHGSAGRQPRLLTRFSFTISNGRRCFAFAGPRSFDCCSSRREF
jgi:hypothetical protein